MSDAAFPTPPSDAGQVAAEHLAGKGHTMPDGEQMAAYLAPIADGTDGPVVMLNLNKYRERAAYADGRDTAGRSGREVYLDYGIVAQQALGHVGAKILWATEATTPLIGCEHDAYDEVLAIWYPNRAAFVELTNFPGYTEALQHREAALAWSSLIPCVGSDDGTLKTPFDV
ncbi:DUF1330 domain-containing protein [Aquihabitans sp. McL0605]|uniref:DUF1330 domain-containing protein n=1 Tax=Aquihabitans sp. McL0605 TaxID=3415671 RepID=UPI003CF63A8F